MSDHEFLLGVPKKEPVIDNYKDEEEEEEDEDESIPEGLHVWICHMYWIQNIPSRLNIFVFLHYVWHDFLITPFTNVIGLSYHTYGGLLSYYMLLLLSW